MEGTETTRAGRRAFAARRWRKAYEAFTSAGDTLAPDDLEMLASAAYLTGNEAAAVDAWVDAHRKHEENGDALRAARCAFWLSLALLLGGEGAQGAGWLERMRRAVKDHGGSVEAGLCLFVEGVMAMRRDPDGSGAALSQALALGERHEDPDLLAFALLGRGEHLIQEGRIHDGVPLLDDAMLMVMGDRVSPVGAGIIYCAVLLTCRDILDLERSREWTEALDRWCQNQPELVAFRGACLVHRSEILQLRGKWSDASSEAERACRWFEERAQTPSGHAFYQRGELFRLAGDYGEADALYRAASENGFEPQPGLSLLRLAQGDVASASAAIRRVVAEAGHIQGPGGGVPRSMALGPYVEIMLASGDLEAAREGAEELERLAQDNEVPLLVATAGESMGAVLLAEGNAREALTHLRRAWRAWQKLEASYESARVQLKIGHACRLLGDHDTGAAHIDSANRVLARLGAPVASDSTAAVNVGAAGPLGRLSNRELEVLTLVAAGKTNKQIANALFISEHTVARHVSNLLRKLGASSRTAAAAVALKLGVEPASQS